jgi:arginase
MAGALAAATPAAVAAQHYLSPDGKLRVALAEQPFSPTGTSVGPNTMATGGVQDTLARLGAVIRIDEARLTAAEDTEYGAWKRLGFALGHFAEMVERNERDGYFTVGLLATCPSMPGLVAGLEHSGSGLKPLRIGMLWLDAHLDPALDDRDVVMGGVRLIDPLEQRLLDSSRIQRVSVDDLRRGSPAVFAQLDRLSQRVDKIYVHVDMDVLDPREVMGHVNKVPNGPSSDELARLFETIFARYPKASAIGFATIPPTDSGGLSIAAFNRMVAGAVRGLEARERAGRAKP